MQPPFRLSLALRLAALFLGLILIVLAAESWLAWRNARERTLADAQEHLLGLAATLVRAAERRWSERPDEVRADIEFQAASPGHRATLLTDGRGRILAAHRRDWEGLSLPDVLPSLSLPLPPTALDALRWQIQGDAMLLAVPWMLPETADTAPGTPPGWLILSYDFHTLLAQRLAEHRRALAWHAALPVSVMLLLGLYIHYRGARPLETLTRALRAVASPGGYRPPELDGAIPEVRALGEAIAQTMAALARQQERLRQLDVAIDASPAQLIITDTQPAILYVNRAFTEVTGYRPDEVLGKNPRLLQSGKTPRETYLDLWTHLKNGRRWSGEFINRRKDGSEYAEFATIAPVFDEARQITHYIAVKFDLTEQRRITERLSHLLTHDPLTGLANRSLLLERIALRLEQGKNAGQNFALVLFDLDGFRAVNERYGTHTGDELLKEIGRTLKYTLTACDTLARLEADEFAVLTDAQPDAAEAGNFGWQLARTISHLLEQDVRTRFAERHPIERLTAAAGIAVFPDDFADAEEILAAAALALQQARISRQPAAVRVYESLSADLLARRSAIEEGLREALAGQGSHVLELHYQGQFDLQHRLCGAEALLRFSHATLGRIPPLECISVAERSELIFTLGSWIVGTALTEAMGWRRTTGWDGTLSVNISPFGLRDPHFAARILELLQQSGHPADRLLFEITESSALDHLEEAERVMRRVAAAGIRWSLDDFGTGFCGLHYLDRLPVAEIKIDPSFVQRAPGEARARHLINAIVEAAAAFSCRVVAEGVEDEAQERTLSAWPELLLQGWHLARPEPAEAFVRRLGAAIQG